MEFSEKVFYDESETDAECSDDSDEDPNFDALEETRLTLSNLSLKRRSKNHKAEAMDENEEEGELNEQDQKSYEIIRKIIEGGDVDRLKVEQCKIYLRKHSLRLSGNKEILIQRIKEHIDIINGGGEKKYPVSSFVVNCKGDSCTGDVVMFEQNVYEEFSIASRSSKGGPCGTRVVAGRILKESYGAAKQQHTFTIEVLWSKGEKPLPPLHPMLIKGRNLYRLHTMRQKWEDEGERQRILSEKHARGGAARLSREARVQQKELHKMQRQTREPLRSLNGKSDKPIKQTKQQHQQQNVHCSTTTPELNVPIQPVNVHAYPHDTSNTRVLPVHPTQPTISQNCNFPRGSQFANVSSSHVSHSTVRGPIHGHLPTVFPVHRYGHENVHPYPHQHRVQNLNTAWNHPPVQRQKCRYFFQGRCHFGDRCKYLHE
ncbi:hypothetical protein ACS0TY_035475 [Phlomoides rotata]